MADDVKIVNGQTSSGLTNLVLPLAISCLFLGGAYWWLGHGLNLPELYLRLAAWLLAVLGLAAVIGAALRFFSKRSPDVERQFYDVVVDALGDPAVVQDSKGRAIYANAPYLQLATASGVSRLVGFDVLYSGYSDFVEPVYQLGQAAREGKAATRDLRLAPGSSAPFASAAQAKWLRMAVTPLSKNSRDGKTLWRLIDITGDRVAQEKAFSRLQFIISYLDQAPVGFFSILPGGSVDYLNATLAGWLGLDMTDVQSGKIKIADLIGEDGAKILAALSPVAGAHRIDTFDLPLRNKAGQEEYFRLVNRSDYDENGIALPARCMVMRKSSEAIEASSGAEDMARFMASIPIGMAEIDSDGKIGIANAQFYELSPAMVRGAKLATVFGVEGASGFAKDLATLAQPGEHKLLRDYYLAGADQRSALFTFSKAKDAKTISVFAVDKTEAKQLEVQLAQSQKMQAIGELASGMAHDFNNMLTPIIGFADLLLTKMRPTDPSFQDVMSIKQNANRAAGLVRHLLAFSRKQTIQPKVYEFSEAMSDLGTLLKRVVGDKIELVVAHARDLWPVMVDIHQMEHVLVNLANNSRDAMPKGGKFEVKTYNLAADASQNIGHPLPEGDYVVCQTTDTGQGIAKEILAKIWDPFFTTKDVGKGTGLGLSMVYGFVKQTGGFIYCDSVVGQGTTFRIFFPRHIPDVNAVEVVKPVEVEAKREDFSGRGRILIVEDEDSVRAFAARALSSRGYTVVEANSGEVGLEVVDADADGFELILSDVVMPEMDGPTMLKELRKRGNTAKFIFMSGYAEDAFEKNPDGPSDFGYLQKPFSLKQLVEKVKTELG
jgi:two-component system, cell cycle sensor histidine kinase and response regulator CckA